MISASKHAVGVLLALFLAGCAPKNAKVTPPPAAQAPPISAGKAGAMYPPPLTETQTQPVQAAPTPEPQVAKAEPPPAPPPPPPANTKKSTSHKSKPSAAKPAAGDSGSGQTSAAPEGTAASPSTTPPPAGDTTDVATNGEPAVTSPIGELTPGDTPGQAQKGKETGDLINKTEDGLNSIKRPLSTQEQETVNQIKAFLGKAKTALTNQDFDAAFILATKAKVLLDELNKT